MLLGQRSGLNRQIDTKYSQEAEFLELYRKGEEVPPLSSGFWQVYRGVIQLHRVNNGQRETVLGWVTANHVFGDLVNGSSDYKAIAISDVYVRRYSNLEVAKNPRLARQLVAELSYRLVRSEQMVAINSISKVEQRLRELFLLLRSEMGHPVTNGTRLTVRFTHQNLADAICTTRVTVTRILGNWQNKGLLEFDCDRHIMFKNF